MFLDLSPQSGVPLYRQMVRQISLRILSGELAPGSQLPSARELAGEIRVNPLTVAKAYQALEQDGLVEMRRGLGTFVLGQSGRTSLPERRTLIADLVSALVAEARDLRIPEADVQRLIAGEFKRRLGKDREPAR